MKLSLVMPARNEDEQVEKTCLELIEELKSEKIEHELIVVNDGSTDGTKEIIENLAKRYRNIRPVHRKSEPGFGNALREGLNHISGEIVVIVMADSSDSPQDVVKYFRKIEEGYDCVFGSRFIRGSNVYDYPFLKLIINRLANTFIKILFLIGENDITNAFKAYRAEVIKTISPIESNYFNITVELPLKAIINGFTRTVIPISWYGRKSGVSKLKISENMKGYFVTVMKIWLAKMEILIFRKGKKVTRFYEKTN